MRHFIAKIILSKLYDIVALLRVFVGLYAWQHLRWCHRGPGSPVKTTQQGDQGRSPRHRRQGKPRRNLDTRRARFGLSGLASDLAIRMALETIVSQIARPPSPLGPTDAGIESIVGPPTVYVQSYPVRRLEHPTRSTSRNRRSWFILYENGLKTLRE